MRKTLIVLLVACTFPSLVISAERNVSADSETGVSKIVSSVSDSTEETTTDKLNKMVGGGSIDSNSRKNLNETVQPRPAYPIVTRPDMTESPTCLYNNSRFSEGAVLSVDKSRAIQCGNKKDSQGRAVAIWKIIK
ncbi:TPA: DUF1496 domain-containing protein [Klebsiella pneumoniae]|uniref:DUF1496 domain-containing protein n=1 Tax=Raoultella ornithinolytica TaxID=54291 RepID=UPI0018C83006|nr:DUF1496 domain-containing protein [Salmonella enterica]EKV8501000.1 DUF1496 domain-containing protein [Escherichia coli]MBG1882690.1 DUF1496 domain-containing protein [Klebsiella pneumoniae]MDH8498430.1 DUF1496 domain-containing protein [Klebsiella pneumoniae]HEL6195760.1 DUF1496 domain-containing protein [Klebsiella pneumoniae]